MPQTCPKCGTDYADDTVICVPCGIDLRTGQSIPVDAATSPERESEDEDAPSVGLRALQVVGDFLPGLFRPALIIAALLVGCAGLGILGLGWILFTQVGALLAAVAVMAAGLVVYAQAIAWVLSGSFCQLNSALVDFEGKHWMLFFIILSLPFAAFFIALHFATQAAQPG